MTVARMNERSRPVPFAVRPRDYHQYHHWTEADDDMVRREYDGTWQSADRIALKLGVTYGAVKARTMRLGVVRSKPPDWTAKEIAFLEQYIEQQSPQWIAARLPGRSLTAVIVKSKRLNLSRRARDGWYCQREACELLGVDHRWLQARIDRGELVASYHHGDRPAQGGMKSWHIEAKALRGFVLSNLEGLRSRNVDLVGLVSLLLGESWNGGEV